MTESEKEKQQEILQKLTNIVMELQDIELELQEMFAPPAEKKKVTEKRKPKKTKTPIADIQLKDCPENIYMGPKRKHEKKVQINELQNITHNYIFDSTIRPAEYEDIVEKNE
jgi:hypothetical protein